MQAEANKNQEKLIQEKSIQEKPKQEQSLWMATQNPAEALNALATDIETDVLIVGAGITGLSTALHLAQLGIRVHVVEAQKVAWGASGRNGGQVIPGLVFLPSEITKKYGERGEYLCSVAASCADDVFNLVAKYDMACDARQKGWIEPAASRRGLKRILEFTRQWRAMNVDLDVLDKNETRERVGTEQYYGAWVDYRGGSVHPLNYTRGLLNACIREGASVYEDTRIEAIESQKDSWLLKSGPYKIKAEHVVLATNGYTDGLWPKLEQSIMPIHSYVIATEPLSDELSASILPYNEACADTSRMVSYYRKDAQNRFVFGGRGLYGEPYHARDWQHTEQQMLNLFPQLKGVSIQYRWFGRVAMTAKHVPHLHEPEKGLHMLLGYNGQGVGMATTLGKHLAWRIAEKVVDFPFPVTRIQALPFHGLKRFYIPPLVQFFRLLDYLER